MKSLPFFPSLSRRGVTLAIALVLLVAGSANAGEFKITKPTSNNFGRRVAVSGDTVIVNEVDGASIYRKDECWSLEAQFSPLPADESCSVCWFGHAVAIDGDVAVISSMFTTSLPTDGRVYIHRRVGTVWSLEATLEGSNFGNFHFGKDVAVSGDTCVVLGGNDAWVFEKQGPTWNLTAQFPNLGFPDRVSLRGDRFIVGARGNDVNSINFAGEAFVFKRELGTWALEQTLHASDLAEFGAFGTSVDIDGDWLAVGAWGQPSGDVAKYGAVYSFHHDGYQWIQQEILGAQIPVAPSSFGAEVSLRDNTLLVSDLGDDTLGFNAGAVYEYERTGMTWTFQNLMTANFGIQGDLYGASCPIDPPPPPPGPKPELLKTFKLVADILVGLTQGGGGIIILPGQGPVPVDPDPFVPAIGLLYDNERSLKYFAGRLAEEYSRYGPVAATRDARDLLTKPKTLWLLIPEDEVDAVAWLSKYGEKLGESREAPVVLFLQADGRGAALLKRLWGAEGTRENEFVRTPRLSTSEVTRLKLSSRN